jgi:hypothetical protein
MAPKWVKLTFWNYNHATQHADAIYWYTDTSMQRFGAKLSARRAAAEATYVFSLLGSIVACLHLYYGL